MPEVVLEYDDNGNIKCPEEGPCSETFPTVEDMVTHIVSQTLKQRFQYHQGNAEGFRKCLFCSHTWPEKYKNNTGRIIPHIDRHFPREIQCNGDCGLESCEYTGGTDKNLKDHIATFRKNLNFQCGSCKRRFSRLTHLENHIKTDHLKKEQVIGYAMKAGFDTGDLAKGSPWMVDAPSSENMPKDRLALKLAEDTIKGFVAATEHAKQSRTRRTWSNGPSSCDDCRKARKRCIHRFPEFADESS